MSSVTAVPLRPLGKGTIVKLWIGLLIVVLLGAGLAWLGTARQQIIQAENGVTYRIFEQGEGEPMTPTDIALARVATVTPSGETNESPEPQPVSAEELPTALRPILMEMRKGGSYQVFAPVSALLDGQSLPPGSPLKPDDVMQFRFQIVDIQRDGVAQQRLQQQMMQQMQQQMMQQQMEGGGAPGGAPQMAPPPPPRPGGR